ncbi:hypothetical protein [Demequina sp. SO4-18]|uniref:hypothetical protein n=1 Tax=Demequina sp. SO4-18 TaxID=3401026 RepID=UPI003B5AD62E
MNLHDELGRHGADAVAESARRLSSSDVRSSLGARVRRGRRRRAVGGGVGAVAGIALVAVGAWSVLPGLGADDAEPAETPSGTASPEAIDGAVEYVIDEEAPISDAVPRDMAGLGCGDTAALRSGMLVYDEGAFGLSVKSEPGMRSDDGTVVEGIDSVWAGYELPFLNTTVVWGENTDITMTAHPFVLHDGEVVGVGDAASMSDVPVDFERVYVPLPGECGAGQGETDAATVGYADGRYTPLVVVEARLPDGTPAATFVFSAGDIEYTGLGEPEVESSPDVDGRAGLGTDGYLANHNMAVQLGDFSCTGTLQAKDVGDPYASGEGSGSLPVPIPSWIETGRLYGYGDDALVGGYPIPLGPDAVGPADAIVAGEARLILTGDAGDTWVFDARWSERDDLPHDEPGWFVELGQVWDCGSPDLIESGEYEARLLYEGSGEEPPFTAVLKPITIVNGVPSLPEIDAQG